MPSATVLLQFGKQPPDQHQYINCHEIWQIFGCRLRMSSLLNDPLLILVHHLNKTNNIESIKEFC